ncbi:MAG: Eco57I restriction-modification methylase domain-containing protein [bacterium]
MRPVSEQVSQALSIPELMELLRDELNWPIDGADLRDDQDYTFEYDPDELGIKSKAQVKIKQLQPLDQNLPWGIFFLEFQSKPLPVMALRDILRSLVQRKRATAQSSTRPAWRMEDLLFICFHTREDGPAVTCVHFKQPPIEGRAAQLTSFGWSRESHNRTVRKFNLPPLRWPVNPGDAEAWRSQWSQAFDKNQLTETFFIEYKELFEKLQDDLQKQTHDLKWAHDFSLQFLNRLMFIYFIQRKRWLGNDPDFIKSFWMAYQKTKTKTEFVSDWLNVLFFEAFNNEKEALQTSQRSYIPEPFRRILLQAPFLNGGLFAKNDIDRKHEDKARISNDRFERIFDFFEKYNFTITEDTPLDQEVAVNPEMIGKVYERLVNVRETSNERGDAGIFYTPRVEIDLMCRLALVDHLANRLDAQTKPDVKNALYEWIFAIAPGEKESANKQLRQLGILKSSLEHLRDIAVLDPACGSGSFLVGMLQILDDLNARLGKPETSYERKKRIIGQNLYGVDVMDWACHVAELRLWLALIIDPQVTRDSLPQNVPLLPNFSFRIRPGNSLVQELGGIDFHEIRHMERVTQKTKDKIDQLTKQKLKYYNNDPTCAYKCPKEINQAEVDLFREILYEMQKSAQLSLQKIKTSLKQSSMDLFGHRSSIIDPLNQKRLEAEARAIESQLENINRAINTHIEIDKMPLIWEIAFAEIFETEKKGFDIVIGNPPYVRQEKIADPLISFEKTIPESRKAYKEKLIQSVYALYPQFFNIDLKTRKPKHKLDAKSDLYIYFYFHGLYLLNTLGSFCFITSNSWLDVGYGKDLQEFLLKHVRMQMIIDNQAKRSFKEADVNTVICLFSSPDQYGEQGAKHTARFVMFKVPFERILNPRVFQEIEAATERFFREEYRVCPVAQKALLEEGYGIGEDETDETEKVLSTYSGNKWGGKYLRAPDIYWTILEKGKGKLVRLGDIAEVRFGIKTGANEFFYLDEARIEEWGIEPEFLKPVIKSPRECKRILIDPDDLKYQIFMCHQEKRELRGTAALEYIKWGESQGFHERPSCRGRRRWWEIKPDTANSIFVKEANETSAVFFNPTLLPVDCRLYFANLNPIQYLYMNSPVSALLLEIYNRAGLGEGARSLMVSDYNKIPVLNTKNSKNEIYLIKNITILTPRNCLKIYNESWFSVDNFIFDILNLTAGEREGVYEAVIHLVETRLKKAESV